MNYKGSPKLDDAQIVLCWQGRSSAVRRIIFDDLKLIGIDNGMTIKN